MKATNYIAVLISVIGLGIFLFYKIYSIVLVGVIGLGIFLFYERGRDTEFFNNHPVDEVERLRRLINEPMVTKFLRKKGILDVTMQRWEHGTWTDADINNVVTKYNAAYLKPSSITSRIDDNIANAHWSVYTLIKYLYNDGTAQFLTMNESKNALTNNNSFLDGLSGNDLIARKVDSLSDYKQRIKESCVQITDEQQVMIRNITTVLQSFLNTVDEPWFNIKQMTVMPWRFIFTKGSLYEYGLPHTVGNNIVLNIDHLDDLVYLKSTILHEQIHVYQRAYPEIVKTFASMNGYVLTGDKDYSTDECKASNPDISNDLYLKNGVPTDAIYEPCPPINITDTKHDHDYTKHPSEEMAYKFEKMLIIFGVDLL